MFSRREIAERISYQVAELTEKKRLSFIERLMKATEDEFEHVYKYCSQGGNIMKVNSQYIIS